MIGAIVCGGATAFLGIAVNYLSGNFKNPWAWLILVLAVILSAFVGNYAEKKRHQRTVVLGGQNELQQDTEDSGTQRIFALGGKNKVYQNIKK